MRSRPSRRPDGDGVVDYCDAQITVGEWLHDGTLVTWTTDLNADDTIDGVDFAMLGNEWGEERLWP